MRNSPAPRRRRRRIVVAIALVLALALGGLVWSAGFLDRDPIHMFEAQGRKAKVGALLFSGDMGLRFGMGPKTATTLAAHGVTVVGASSPTLFGTHRTRAEVDAIVAQTVRQALARTGTDRIVLIGQSYGADILQTGLAALPQDLRTHVAGIILVVPGQTVFFRADPSGIAYRGTPDSLGITTAHTLDWTPITCIYGTSETDSLCPLLHVPGAHVIGMPGGHFLNHDDAALEAHVLTAVAAAER